MWFLFLILSSLFFVQSAYAHTCPAETISSYTYGVNVTYDAAQDVATTEATVVCAAKTTYKREHHIYHAKRRSHCHAQIVAC